jgi:outer membrane receptor for ferrienterochelin and colicins
VIKHIFIVGWLFPFAFSAQIISGTVTNDKNEPLIGATVHWIGTTVGVATGNHGEFQISSEAILNKKLIARYVGYAPDTLTITNQSFVEFRLTETNALGEVIVEGQRDGVIISDSNPIKTEQITQTELGKSACCDLAGCFETQTTVQPQTTNVITNSKELRILGLSGVLHTGAD